MTSRPAIEPAISTLPVMNQLMANVSSVPSVRQLTALRTDLACVSAPRNSTRQCLLYGPEPNLPRRRTKPLHHPRFRAGFRFRRCHTTVQAVRFLDGQHGSDMPSTSARCAPTAGPSWKRTYRGSGHGVEMRLIAVLGAICALTQSASAEIGDCSAI